VEVEVSSSGADSALAGIWVKRLAFAPIVVLALFRIAHVRLLWADEDYHLAAAIHLLAGKVPYRDFWYDKPPLSALYYALIGGWCGWPLRLLDAAYVLLACYLVFRLCRSWWSELEGYVGALLLAFFTTFYLPSAVIPFAADAIMLVPHLAAVYFASRRRAFTCGICAGIAFLANTKALFVLAVCGIWAMSDLLPLALGFCLPVAVGLTVGLGTGALNAYWEQVWRWGFLYAKGSPVLDPLANGALRTGNWLGFHFALVVAAIYGMRWLDRNFAWKLGTWTVLSYAAVALGFRFAPHYFLQLLPPLTVLASFGVAHAIRGKRKWVLILVGASLLVPVLRFGPRYAVLAFDDLEGRAPQWSDVAMDLDSQAVARFVRASGMPGESLFVWGYRPDIYVFTRLYSDSRYWDSQPLTGVPADRHLHATGAIYSRSAVANRAELTRSHPAWIVDGLGLLNPKLELTEYPELRSWMVGYQQVGRTNLSVIYHRK